VDLAKSRCVVSVDTLPLTAEGAWFDLWAGAVAVDALCVSQGKAGMVYSIGEFVMMS